MTNFIEYLCFLFYVSLTHNCCKSSEAVTKDSDLERCEERKVKEKSPILDYLAVLYDASHKSSLN